MEKAFTTFLREKVALTGAGRTDTGVHARQMFAHFDFDGKLPNDFVKRLNSFLPKDIALHTLYRVQDDAHARFDATQRSYQYYITQKKNPFSLDFAYYFQRDLDIDLMNEACQILLQNTDFQCFSKSKTDVRTYICKIEKAFFQYENDLLVFHISADRFLRNMVRAIVGTLLEVGQKKINLADFQDIINSKNRNNAGFSVPGNALFLTQVQYPPHIFIAKI